VYSTDGIHVYKYGTASWNTNNNIYESEFLVSSIDTFNRQKETSIEKGTLNCRDAFITGSVMTGGKLTQVWFEWGKTPDLKNVTKKWIVILDSHFGCWLNNLDENTKYYYRLVCTLYSDTLKASIESFSTPICQY
jgi:hypothetical protein